jgi:hypothetical protein
MTCETVPDISSKIYEVNFDPITLTSDMRKNLFMFYKQADLMAQQVELEVLSQPNIDSQELAIQAVNDFNNLKNLVEDFISSN